MIKDIYSNEFEDFGKEAWTGGAFTYDLPSGTSLSSSIYVLNPGMKSGLYHFHHGTEEMLIMIKGTPVLKTFEGSRRLSEGEVVCFGIGPESAHQVINDTDEAVRMIFVGYETSPDAVEYPDEGLLSIMAKTKDQHGEYLWDLREYKKK